MNVEPVTTKNNFVPRYAEGEFGNRPITWNTLTEYLNSGYEGLIHIRNRRTGGPTWYNVHSNEVERMVRIINYGGYWDSPTVKGWAQEKEENLYFSAMCPTECTLIQGEVQRSSRHLELLYSTARKPMRQALEERPLIAHGLRALILLRKYLNSRSMEWMEHLLETYEDHVIEFTVLQRCWGMVPGHNTLFWEVRKY